MNWWMQIWHVAKKDIVYVRWLLAMQVLVTGIALAAALDPGGHGGGQPGFALRITHWMEPVGGPYILFVVLAVLISAVVVQADSPSRSDAFWASRPLHPLAVLMAKAAMLGVFLVVLPVTAYAVALWQHSASPARIVSFLIFPLIVQSTIVVAAGALAALTADLRTLVMAGLGVFVAGGVVVLALQRVLDDPAFIFGGWLNLLLPSALGLAVLAHQYSTRNLRRGVIGATLGSVAGLVLLGWTSQLSDELWPVTVADDFVQTELRFGEFETEPVARDDAGERPDWMLWTTVRLADPDPRFEYKLRDVTVLLYLSDGSVRRVHNTRPVALGPMGEQPGGLEWPFGSPDADVAGARIEAARLSSSEVQLLAAEGARIELRGRVEVVAAEEWGSLPLSAGAKARGESSGARVLAVRTPGASGPLLELFIESTRAFLDLDGRRIAGHVRYALVNRELGQGILVRAELRRERPHGMVVEWLANTRAARVDLDVPWVFVDGGRVRAVDESWTDDAELMIIRTASAGGYNVALEQDVRIELDGIAPR